MKKCGGKEVSRGKRDSVLECAEACYGVALMFVFGTNEFGKDRCNEYGKQCECYCETSARLDGTCDQLDHKGFRLYKYGTPSKY